MYWSTTSLVHISHHPHLPHLVLNSKCLPTFPLMISCVTRPRSPESMSTACTNLKEGGCGWCGRVHGGCVGNRSEKGRGSGEEGMGEQWLSGKGEGGGWWLWKMRKGGSGRGGGEEGGGKEASIYVHIHSLVRVEKYAVCHWLQDMYT